MISYLHNRFHHGPRHSFFFTEEGSYVILCGEEEIIMSYCFNLGLIRIDWSPMFTDALAGVGQCSIRAVCRLRGESNQF